MIIKGLDWAEFKVFINQRSLSIQFVEFVHRYDLYGFDGQLSFGCFIDKDNLEDLDLIDFEENYKPNGNKKIEIKSLDGFPLFVPDKGKNNFTTLVTHDWTDNTTWPATNDSSWILEPTAGNKILLTKAEVQFTHDVQLGSLAIPGELYFDIWVYNPLVDLNSPLDPDDPAWHPSQGATINPLRFLYNRNIYKSLRDVFNYGNEHFTMDVGVDGFTVGVTTVQFNYDQIIQLRSDEGAQIRFSMKDDLPMGGDFCTISLIIREEIL